MQLPHRPDCKFQVFADLILFSLNFFHLLNNSHFVHQSWKLLELRNNYECLNSKDRIW